jgi:hypothetical protein
MNRDSIIILVLLGILVLGVRWYAYQNNNFLVIGQANPTASLKPTVLPTQTPAPTALPTPKRTPKPTPQATPASRRVLIDVPFVSQAPFGDWTDPHQQDGCEETSVLMTMRWVRNLPLTPQEGLEELKRLSEFSEAHYGTFHDTSIGDTFKFFNDFYNYSNVELKYDSTIEDIKAALSAGAIVIVPADGRLLQNPHFTPPGPIHHMLVIKGFDDGGQYFITNEPGTKYGESYRYSYSVMQKAIRDYPTGHHEPLTSVRSAMIVVSR